MADYKNIIIEKKGAKNNILFVTINREKALNALNKETVAELQNAFDAYKADASVACVIVTGAGEKSFVAGADITEIHELNAQSGDTFSQTGLRLMQTIQDFPRPVIAAVNGFALGGGCELAMACDFRLASEKAKLGQPEVNLGIIPGYGGTQRLPRLVGMGKAKQLTFTGEIITAQEAHRIGLVDEVYAPDQLIAKAMEIAETIASKGPVAVSVSKECINQGMEVSQLEGCRIEQKKFGQVCGTADMKEGTKAFMEKRKADFTGK